MNINIINTLKITSQLSCLLKVLGGGLKVVAKVLAICNPRGDDPI